MVATSPDELRAQRHLPGSAVVFERVSGDEAEARTNADGLIMARGQRFSACIARRRFTPVRVSAVRTLTFADVAEQRLSSNAGRPAG